MPRKAKNTEKTMVNFKADDREIKKIKANARKYAGGNTSLWLRFAAMNYKPDRSLVD